ncbi:hypothetical protein [Spongiimicrobium sp. 3-5]
MENLDQKKVLEEEGISGTFGLTNALIIAIIANVCATFFAVLAVFWG